MIVEATNPLPNPGNYWIRTWRASCFRFTPGDPGYETTGIVRYGNSQALPTTSAWNVSQACSDETYTSLKPIVPWTVGKAINDPSGHIGENLTVQLKTANDYFFPLAVFSIGGDNFNPLQIDYGNPTFLNLNFTGKWNPLWVVYPENYTDTDWVCSESRSVWLLRLTPLQVYLVIKGKGPSGNTVNAHPVSATLVLGRHFNANPRTDTSAVSTPKSTYPGFKDVSCPGVAGRIGLGQPKSDV